MQKNKHTCRIAMQTCFSRST